MHKDYYNPSFDNIKMFYILKLHSVSSKKQKRRNSKHKQENNVTLIQIRPMKKIKAEFTIDHASTKHH